MTMTDTIRAVAAYVIALVVVVGGFLFLYNTTETADKVVVAGFVGSALTFVFGSEVQTRTARQAATQTAASIAASNGNGGDSH